MIFKLNLECVFNFKLNVYLIIFKKNLFYFYLCFFMEFYELKK